MEWSLRQGFREGALPSNAPPDHTSEHQTSNFPTYLAVLRSPKLNIHEGAKKNEHRGLFGPWLPWIRTAATLNDVLMETSVLLRSPSGKDAYVCVCLRQCLHM